MIPRLLPLHQHPHLQCDLQAVLNLSAPFPPRMSSLTQQILQSLAHHHFSLLLHPLTPPPFPPPLFQLFRSLTRRAQQSSSQVPPPNPCRPFPTRRPPPYHDPLYHLHSTITVSLTRTLFFLVLSAKVKMANLLHPLGLLCTCGPSRMAKTTVLVSELIPFKLVLAVPALVPRRRLCLVQD